MTKYAQEKFSVSMPHSQEYKDNWDRVFGTKPSVADRTIDMFTGKTKLDTSGSCNGEDCDICDAIYKGAQEELFIDRPEPEGSVHDEVREFHVLFGAPIAKTPTIPPVDRVKLRIRLITEEYCELLDATGMGVTANYIRNDVDDRLCGYDGEDLKEIDIVGVADALGDLAYVIEGANLEFGIPSRKVSREIHRSNCSKLGPDGKPVYREDGKITKGPNYTPPDIAGVLREAGWNGTR